MELHRTFRLHGHDERALQTNGVQLHHGIVQQLFHDPQHYARVAHVPSGMDDGVPDELVAHTTQQHREMHTRWWAHHHGNDIDPWEFQTEGGDNVHPNNHPDLE